MNEALLLKDKSNPPKAEESEVTSSDLETVVVTEEDLQSIKKARRLKELQDKIDKGKYSIPSEDIAQSILNQD